MVRNISICLLYKNKLGFNIFINKKINLEDNLNIIRWKFYVKSGDKIMLLIKNFISFNLK